MKNSIFKWKVVQCKILKCKKLTLKTFCGKNFHLQQGAPLLIMQAGEAITAT